LRRIALQEPLQIENPRHRKSADCTDSLRCSAARACARNPKRLSRRSSSKVLPPTGFLGKEPRNDGMNPRPLICGLAMGQECSVTFKTARRVRDGSYNDWNRFGKERVRSVRGG